MIPTLPHSIYLFVLGGVFLHFVMAGGRTFSRSQDDDAGAGWGQFSFLFTGTIATWLQGLYVPIHLFNGIASAVLLLGSLSLYEWARHVIWGRGFYVAFDSNAPDSLCDSGPYAHIRHPLYASYILAFLSVLVALPTLTMLAVFAFNVVLFVCAAISDERNLARSPFAAAHAEYKRHTGMFFPRVFTRRGPAGAERHGK